MVAVDTSRWQGGESFVTVAESAVQGEGDAGGTRSSPIDGLRCTVVTNVERWQECLASLIWGKILRERAGFLDPWRHDARRAPLTPTKYDLCRCVPTRREVTCAIRGQATTRKRVRMQFGVNG